MYSTSGPTGLCVSRNTPLTVAEDEESADLIFPGNFTGTKSVIVFL